MSKKFISVISLLLLTIFPLNLIADVNSPLTISVKEKNGCDNKKERYTEIYPDIFLSNKYILLSSKKFDINKDGVEDFIAIVEYSPSVQKNCSMTEFDKTYGVILSLSSDNGHINWFSSNVVGNLDFSEFNVLNESENGFDLSFALGHSYNAFLKASFLYDSNKKEILLATLDYTPLYPDFEKRIIINYQKLSQYSIKNVSVAERLAEDF